MTTVTFDGVTLREPDVKRAPKPVVTSNRLVSGKMKHTPSAELETAYTVSCLCTLAEYAVLLGKIGGLKTLVVDSTTITNCVIKSWKEKDLNPETVEVTVTFERDTS